MHKATTPFIPGFLVGGITGMAVTAALCLSGPIATRDRVFNEVSSDLLQTVDQLQRCSTAYVASHDGKLPKGSLVEGEGRSMIVIGFEPGQTK